MLKTYNESVENKTIGGIQKMSDAQIHEVVIKRLLEAFATEGGLGHVNFVEGDVIGTFTDSYWPINYTESLIKDTVVYNFENGAQGWNFDAAGFGIQTDQALGTQSIGLDQTDAPQQLAHIEPPELTGGVQINRVQFSYWETSSSTGGGLLLKDSSGNDVIGAATDNPQWSVIDDNGGSIISTETKSYETWYTVRIYFYWDTGTATVSWYDDSDTLILSMSDRPLINNTNVARLDIQNYTSGTFQGGTNFYMRLDNIQFEYPVSVTMQTDTRDIYQHWDDPGIVPIPQPIMDYKNGDLHKLSKEELISKIIDPALEELSRTDINPVGCFRFFEGLQLPAGVSGSWEIIGTLEDEQAQDGSTTYTLWNKIAESSPSGLRPLKWNYSLKALQKMNPDEIKELLVLLQERMYETGIGRYAFSVDSPQEGTWAQVSIVNDELAESAIESYARTYQEPTYYGTTTISYYGTRTQSYYGSTSSSRPKYAITYYGSTFRTGYYGTFRQVTSSTESGGGTSTEFFSGEIINSPDETIEQYKLWVRLA